MALFTIGDLHLAFGCEKPMDVFAGWTDYVGRLETNWKNRISDEDTVVIPGDVSWGMTLQEADPDLKFIHGLPGNKIILKGNHDYWWSTLSKMNAWIGEKRYNTITFLQNEAVLYGRAAICGTRGWMENDGDPACQKVFLRECQRLRLSLSDAEKKGAREKLVFLHYPPVYSNYTHQPILNILEEYGVKQCFFGHIHGQSIRYALNGIFSGVDYRLVSADFLRFSPYFVRDRDMVI